jgi:hypothetical protein
MSATTPTFLPFKIEDLPTAIFFNPASAQREQGVAFQLRLAASSRTFATEELLEELSLRPHMMADIFRQKTLQPHERALLAAKNPAMTLRAMLHFYDDLAPELEQEIMNDLESVERLVSYFDLRKRSGMHPREYYLSKLEEDPNRYLRVCDNDDFVPIEELKFKLAVMADKAEANRFSSPAWAFFYLRCSMPSTIEPALIAALRPSEAYCYLTARLCDQASIPSHEWAPLTWNLKEPRWIYHALRDGLATEPETAINTLMSSPPWLVQYMSRARLSYDESKQLFLECQEQNISRGSTAFLTDMEIWFQGQGRNFLVDELMSSKRTAA